MTRLCLDCGGSLSGRGPRATRCIKCWPASEKEHVLRYSRTAERKELVKMRYLERTAFLRSAKVSAVVAKIGRSAELSRRSIVSVMSGDPGVGRSALDQSFRKE